MRSAPFANRFLRLALPMVSIVAVGITGVILLHTSHALDTTSENFVVARNNAEELPTTGTTDCCQISLDKAVVNDNPSRHLSASVTVLNTTTQTVQISPGLQMFIVDSNGDVHPFTAAYLPAGASVGGPLGAGSSRTEQLDFDLAPADIPKLFVFQSDAAATPLLLRVAL